LSVTQLSVFEDIQAQGSLTPALEKRLVEEFGSRGKRAMDAVRSKKIKKYRDFFVVEGSTGSYIVEDDFCTCKDYIYRLSVKGGVCYHSIAVRIAKAMGEYEEIDQWYSDVMPEKGTNKQAQ
jgi:predicted nucleic acid-binding Zn finger protein